MRIESDPNDPGARNQGNIIQGCLKKNQHIKQLGAKGVLRWPDNNSMFRRLSCNRATSKE
jgi:hypothetical protein